MFTRASRWSIGNEEQSTKIYDQAKNDWTQAGALAVQRYRITDGQHAGQQMTVIRFHDKATHDHAAAALESKRVEYISELNVAGTNLQETMLLDEIV